MSKGGKRPIFYFAYTAMMGKQGGHCSNEYFSPNAALKNYFSRNISKWFLIKHYSKKYTTDKQLLPRSILKSYSPPRQCKLHMRLSRGELAEHWIINVYIYITIW